MWILYHVEYIKNINFIIDVRNFCNVRSQLIGVHVRFQINQTYSWYEIWSSDGSTYMFLYHVWFPQLHHAAFAF